MDIEKKVEETIKKYRMFSKKDKILVALSGGKDSTSILFILKKFGYNVSGLMIDLHLGEWSKIHRKNMEEFCKENNILFHLVDLKKEIGQGICFIKEVLKREKNLTGCAVCGITKRWILNKWAKKLKADVLVTGHNLDDECQTILMNFLKGNIFLGINSFPVTGERKVEGFVQRVKPLFFVPESEIKKYAIQKKFKILYDRCPCAIGTYRVETRAWLNDISNKEKLLIVKNWLKILPEIKKRKEFQFQKCKICGDPSRGEICRACEIFNFVKK
ncbi:MAG: ATP-binding protein [Candidatus Pacearchaeota archaeon]